MSNDLTNEELDKVAAIIYRWHPIERDDFTVLSYNHLSFVLKETLRRLAKEIIAARSEYSVKD